MWEYNRKVTQSYADYVADYNGRQEQEHLNPKK